MERLDFYKTNAEAMKPMMAFEQQIAKSSLEKTLVELIRLRASQINGCAYCVDLHSADARKAGEDERRITALVVWRDTPFFSPRERAALAWAESLTLISENHVPDAVWHEAESQFSGSELVELTLVINTINAWNRLAIAFRKLPT